MKTSSTALFTAEQIRDCERLALASGVTESELMASAGLAAFISLKKKFPHARKLLIFCGNGNNAGDGYVLALLAHEAGYSVKINHYKLPEQLPAAAQAAADAAIAGGLSCRYMDDTIEKDTDLIVDALLGTGLRGAVTEPMAGAINRINESGLPVLALDIPSGLEADSGSVMGVAVKAKLSVAFIGLKTGMMTLDGPDHCGEIVCDDLNLSACLAQMAPAAQLLSQKKLPARLKNCHKGDFGHVLIVGGGKGMPGAVCLAATAALRVGAGLVSLATRAEYANACLAALPEALIYGINQPDELAALIEKASICLIGPGLGTDEWANDLFLRVLAARLPLIVDASALRLLADHPVKNDYWVLTPHPGEAASLSGCSTRTVQQDRFKSVASLQKKYGGNIVLKGVGSLVRTDDSCTWLCAAGNPGMASAGMGDVLSGVIAGLAAQGASLAAAASMGVWMHARAADLAVQSSGERGLLASDLMPFLRQLANGMT